MHKISIQPTKEVVASHLQDNSKSFTKNAGTSEDPLTQFMQKISKELLLKHLPQHSHKFAIGTCAQIKYEDANVTWLLITKKVYSLASQSHENQTLHYPLTKTHLPNVFEALTTNKFKAISPFYCQVNKHNPHKARICAQPVLNRKPRSLPKLKYYNSQYQEFNALHTQALSLNKQIKTALKPIATSISIK